MIIALRARRRRRLYVLDRLILIANTLEEQSKSLRELSDRLRGNDSIAASDIADVIDKQTLALREIANEIQQALDER